MGERRGGVEEREEGGEEREDGGVENEGMGTHTHSSPLLPSEWLL